jgi:hypothetical protein
MIGTGNRLRSSADLAEVWGLGKIDGSRSGRATTLEHEKPDENHCACDDS